MATYAIGDIQGCARTLQRLLARCEFAPGRDRLWLVGDLVNRGPDSLATLRLLVGMRHAVTAVLGNHDLHLLAVYHGVRALAAGDTLAPLLAAADAPALLAWLQGLPLLVADDGHALLHAGLLPRWTWGEAHALADAIAARLQGPDARAWLALLAPGAAVPTAEQPLVAAAQAMTNLRVCDASGAAQLAFNGPPAAAPPGCVPWFAAPGRRTRTRTIVCGHWAALGLHLQDGVRALDTGAVYGRALTAYRLEDGCIFTEPASPR